MAHVRTVFLAYSVLLNSFDPLRGHWCRGSILAGGASPPCTTGKNQRIAKSGLLQSTADVYKSLEAPPEFDEIEVGEVFLHKIEDVGKVFDLLTRLLKRSSYAGMIFGCSLKLQLFWSTTKVGRIIQQARLISITTLRLRTFICATCQVDFIARIRWRK